MRRKNIIIIHIVLLILAVLWILYLSNPKDIIIQEAKIVTGVDENLTPLKVTNLFPKNTAKVSAWISWRNAKINTQLLVKWYYLTDDLPIYDYNLSIPKREGIANIVLAMPEGKTLPSGLYKVTLLTNKKQIVKPLTFKIQ